MRVKTVAIIEIVLGALVIAASMWCPPPLGNIVLGALVLVFGVVLLVKPQW